MDSPGSGYHSQMRVRAFPWVGLLICSTLAVSLPPRSTAETAGSAASDLEAVREAGELRMLAWPHQESEFVRRMIEELGTEGLDKFTGLDVDLLRGFAHELGVELKVTPANSFADLLPALLEYRGDIVASSLTITPARKELVDFSRPYFFEKSVVVVRKGSDIDAIDDLAGQLAASVAGSSHEERLRGRLGEELRLSPTQFTLESLTQVLEGDADYTLVDATTIETAAQEYVDIRQKLKVAFEFPEQEAYGVALRPGSDLLPRLDDYLRRMEESGELAALWAKYGLD